MMSNSRVLIVDDERQNIKVLSNFLKDEYKIMAAKSGEQALKLAQGVNPPDIILLDIIMPDMDGYEVCKKLKEDPCSMNIPVMFVTAISEAMDAARGFEMGAVDYITKPFNLVTVKARIKTHLQLKRKTDLLERMALLDGLTEIPNRRAFDKTLEKEFKRAARNKTFLSMIIMDIDFFKNYNDHYGHALGDTCLQKVAKTIESMMKRDSDFTARYGGEEFAMILPETNIEGAMNIAEKILTAIVTLNIEHKDSKIAEYVSISIGIAGTTVEPEVIPVDLIKSADAALYQAKENGRNQAVISDQHKVIDEH
jgi:diguanylate cyclase (GGDEF)-like protein